MGTVLQMPFSRGEASQVGPRLFRKQVLRQGSIRYQGRTLNFDRAYLSKLVEHFRQGAFRQVPFVLADADNKHNEAPENFRGDVKALELTPDGLDAIIELTEKGAELVRENPRLGASARIVEVAGDGPPKYVPALRHVCGTLNEHIDDMRDWEPVSLTSDRWGFQDGNQSQVVDLTSATYMAHTDTKTLTDEQLDELKGLKPEERTAKVQELLGESAPAETPEDKDKPRWSGLKKLLGIPADADEAQVDEALGRLSDKDEADKDRKPETDKHPVALSKEAQEAIDLANSTAAEAKREAAEATRKLREAEFDTFKADLVRKGVPPADIDLAKPLLMGEAGTIDLSNGEKADTVDLAKKLLEARAGTVDLTGETGSGEGVEDDKAAEAKDLASDEKWGASV